MTLRLGLDLDAAQLQVLARRSRSGASPSGRARGCGPSATSRRSRSRCSFGAHVRERLGLRLAQREPHRHRMAASRAGRSSRPPTTRASVEQLDLLVGGSALICARRLTLRGSNRSACQGAFAGHGCISAAAPARLEVVVVRAPRLARLARELLPARASGRGQVGDHPPAGRPDRLERVVRVPADLADGLLAAADLRRAVEEPAPVPGSPRRARAGSSSSWTLPQRQPAGSSPKRSARSSRRRAASRARASSQERPISSSIALLPERQHVRLPAPGRGDVGHEAVVGAVEPALGEVAVADRRARHLAARSAA